jgi:alkanesulfonate monooxygenase SsuD/methylene tetrahydromethanopterin reductase-like flavin-dependent oxidoreductase (luciferase family)
MFLALYAYKIIQDAK